jgi:uncharacterized delta-60 repeat protein
MRILTQVALALALAAAAHAALPGELDPTFNGGQPVFLNPALTVPRFTQVHGAAYDDLGGLVVAGSTTDATGSTALFVARIAPDGTPDTAFGTGGTTVLQLGLGTTPSPAPFSAATSIGRRAGGMGWVVGGWASVADGDPAKYSGLAVAFDANGMLDPSYATGGVARPKPTMDTDQLLPGVSTVGPDGRVYIAGGYLIQGRNDYIYFLVFEVTPTGASGFAYVDNIDLIGPIYRSSASRPLVMPTELIVPGSTEGISDTILAVQRVSQSGTGGIVYRAELPGNSGAQGIAAAPGPDGKLYVAGVAKDPNGIFAIVVSRLMGGIVDEAFGTGGTSRFQAELEPGGGSSAAAMVIQPDGRIVVAGNASNYQGNERQGIVLRLDADGNLDPSFGGTGIVHLDFGVRDNALDALLSPDGRSVVVTGSSVRGSVQGGTVTRILLEPLTTTTSSTTTTLPGGCAAGPSLEGAGCRLATLAAAVDAATPPGKLEKKLLRGTTAATEHLSAAISATGKAQRRKLRKALGQLRKLAQRLESKAARRDIAAETRAALAAETSALASEVEVLSTAVPS